LAKCLSSARSRSVFVNCRRAYSSLRNGGATGPRAPVRIGLGATTLVRHFTGYFDESGTHAGTKVSTMAGFIGDARQWRKYEKRTSRLFARYGVRVFHAIDVRRGHGAFKGWSIDRKIEFLDNFQHIINETLESGVATFIRDDDYKYYLGLYWPPRTRWDSKYTIMFRACLAQIVDTIGHIPQRTEPRLHVVLEDGHTNAEDARRNYEGAEPPPRSPRPCWPDL
jgi:hypothetical protein